MIRSGRRRGWWLVALAVFTVVAGLRASNQLQPLEDAAADTRARLLRHEVHSDIVIVGIDEPSIAALDEWPWPRRRHARLIEQLTAASPASVYLDIDFSAPSSPLDDARLEAALARPRDFPVMLPAYIQNADLAGKPPVVVRPLRRFVRHADVVAANVSSPHARRVRSLRNLWAVEGARLPSVIDPRRVLPEAIDVPIDFSISPSSFTGISYVDLVQGRVPRSVIAGKTLFVGETATHLGDMWSVPVYGSLPGVVVQALATETVNAGAPRPTPVLVSMALLALWTLLAALSYTGNRGARRLRNFAVLAVLLASSAGIAAIAFEYDRLVLDCATPMLVIALLYVAATARSLEIQAWRALAYAFGARRRDVLLKSVVNSSTDSIVCVDETGIIRTANPAASRLFGCAAYELIDEPIAKFITLLAGEGASARLGALHGLIRECDARTLDGDVFPVEISMSRVRLNTGWLYTAIVRDIRERRAQQRRLQHQATHDSLTGLPNRAALLAYLEAALAKGAPPTSVALLMLDLCRFKEVNDTLGHTVGDRVLCEVAQRFAGALGARGFIARIGGDEFTVVLESPHDAEAIVTVALSLVESLKAPIDVAGISIEVGVSIGAARFPEDASEAQTLLRHADAAMFIAKRRGANYECHDATRGENGARKLAIGGDLRAAIANDELELHFQPQINLRSGLVESAEALLRWSHPVHGAINPAEFIAVAEASDLIRPLTEWTLAGALTQIRRCRERGVHVRIAVNLSARLLQDMAFPARLRNLLEAAAVSASALEIEVTESAMMLDPARALRVIQEIARQGVLISIDDFGTGYSSLSYLRDLPVHSLKLDKSFVLGMRNSTDDRIIVESTAQLGHALKLELVAEGVETEWESQFLAASGYDYAQGFLYSRALPAEKCLAWIVEFNATAMLAAGDTAVTAALRARTEDGDSHDLRSRRA